MTNLADNFVTTASGFPVYVNAVAPLNPQIGMAWHSTSSGLQVWNGTAWVSVGGGGSAAVDTQQVVMAPNVAGIGAAWTALASPPTLSGKVTFGLFNGDIYVLTDEANPGVTASWLKVSGAGSVNVPTTQPTTPVVGATWYDATATPPGIQFWNGTVWGPISKNAVTVAGAAPASPATGQFWLNISVNPNVLNVWTGTSWMLVDNQPAVSATAPAIKGVGNIWLDTGVVPNVLKIWDGSTWVPPAPVITIGPVQPTVPTNGNFWLDTSGTAPALKLRNAATWMTVGDVVGPATATDNAVARFDGTTGKLIQNSGVIVDDTNNVSGVHSIAVTANANNSVVASTGVMNLAAGQMFTATAAAAITWSFTNVPASRGTTVVLTLTYGGAFAQTWPASVKWPGGTAPMLTAAGIDVLVFVTVDGGTTWRGNIFAKDAK